MADTLTPGTGALTAKDVNEALRLLRVAQLAGGPKEVLSNPTTEAERAARDAAIAEIQLIRDIWLVSFADWSAAQLRAAVIAYLNSADPKHRFWPTPGLVRAALPTPPAEALPTPEEIWSVALALLKSCGGGEESGFFGLGGSWVTRPRVGRWRYQMIQRVGQPLMERALAAMGGVDGYNQIAAGSEDEHVAHRARFCRAWDGAVQREEDGRRWDQLVHTLGQGMVSAGRGPAALFGRPTRPATPPALEVLEGGRSALEDELLGEGAGSIRDDARIPAIVRPDQGWG